MQRGFLNNALTRLLAALRERLPMPGNPERISPGPEKQESSVSQRYLATITQREEIPDPCNGVDVVNIWCRTNQIHAYLQCHDNEYYQYVVFVKPGTMVLIP